MAMRFEVVLVTPEMAARWLAQLDPEQRKCRSHLVDQYLRDMIADNWPLTHQGIAFNTARALIDGQHRLQAIVEYGHPVLMVVVHDVEGDYRLPIDSGLKRRPTDLLHLRNQTIAATGVLLALQQGSIRRTQTFSVEELRGAHAKYERDLTAACEVITRGLATAAAAGAIAFARPLNPQRIDDFIAAVRMGEQLAVASPAWQLRNWFLKHSKGSDKHRRFDVVMITLAAVWSELRGVEITRLYVGTNAYDQICVKRRSKRIPDTPSSGFTPNALPGGTSRYDDLMVKITDVFRLEGPLSPAALCEHLFGSPDHTQETQVQRALVAMKRKGTAINPTRGIWTLAAPHAQAAE